MTTEQPEQRWCICGWSTVGTDKERHDAFERHWQSRKHKRRLKDLGDALARVVSRERPV